MTKETQEKLLEQLRDAGAFDVRGGSFEVHFDTQGNPAKIEIHTYHKLSTPKPLDY